MAALFLGTMLPRQLFCLARDAALVSLGVPVCVKGQSRRVPDRSLLSSFANGKEDVRMGNCITCRIAT